MSSAAVSVSVKSKVLNGTVNLTGSKSESNRALIMQALAGSLLEVDNISEAADTETLVNILREAKTDGTIDIGPAGTAMRFLTAYYALQSGEIVLTGSERMKQRPIGILVDALQKIGADISYEENEGFPPLRITGPLQQAQGRVSIKGNISSQYISALLLIAPSLPKGLELHIEGELTSRPYVEMTLAMISQAGINHEWNGSLIRVPHQEYKATKIHVEPDWSAASYWYSIAALADESRLFLRGLTGNSLQGDSKIAGIMKQFGVSSQFSEGGVWIEKTGGHPANEIIDFIECPDLAQTVIVCAAAKGYNLSFTGMETLKIKETDRVKALQVELSKIGVKLLENDKVYTLDCSGLDLTRDISVATYDDHRMAMAFAPLAVVMEKVRVEDHRVVEKSYPDYWKHLEEIGFNIRKEQN